jgi:hypothetical protein
MNSGSVAMCHSYGCVGDSEESTAHIPPYTSAALVPFTVVSITLWHAGELGFNGTKSG